MRSVLPRAMALVVLLLAPPRSEAHPNDPFFAPGDENGTFRTPIAPSDDCTECHAGVDLPERAAPGDTWLGSMKANSFRDPLFQAALAIANQDILDSGTFCLRCHAPVGWLEEHGFPADGSGLDGPQAEGPTCALCHRLESGDDRDIPGPLVGNGSLYFADDAVYRGTRRDGQSPHPTQNSKHLGTSFACAGCHSASNPARPFVNPVEPDIERAPRFPLIRTFEEWSRSAFFAERVECQTCHMPQVTGRAARGPEARVRADLRSHDFAGGNAWGPLLLDAAYPGERPEAYAHARDSAVRMLQRAADVRLEDLPAVLDPERPLPFVVRVENLTGHKLPTGYPDLRRVWLEVTARIGDEPPFFVSGFYDEAEAVLVEDDQIRTYEARSGVAGDGPGFHWMLNDTIFVDTRIPPRGFRPAFDGEPSGRDYAAPEGGFRHWDEAPYVLTAPPSREGVVTVTARLMYQSVTREMVEWLRDENVIDDRGARLHALWQATGRAAPVEMARAEARVLLPDTPVGPDACNGVDDDRDGTADEGPDGGGFGTLACGLGACAREVPACLDGALGPCVPNEPVRESCNGQDDDCDGSADEQIPDFACGFGLCRRVVPGCQEGRRPVCTPGAAAPETCDGRDEDCDGRTDEDLGTVTCGQGACRRVLPACRDGAFRPCEPGAPAPEVCDGEDDDCDDVIDEAIEPIRCGAGRCAAVVPGCVDGAPAACVPGAAEPERCNGLDDDCDASTDEALGDVACGVGACVRVVPACDGGAPVECQPGVPAAEVCNGADDDCDGRADEALGELRCGVGACARAVEACSGGAPAICRPGAPVVETCNGVDDDCDERTDETCGTDAAPPDDGAVPDAADDAATPPDDGAVPDTAVDATTPPDDGAVPDATADAAVPPDAGPPGRGGGGGGCAVNGHAPRALPMLLLAPAVAALRRRRRPHAWKEDR